MENGNDLGLQTPDSGPWTPDSGLRTLPPPPPDLLNIAIAGMPVELALGSLAAEERATVAERYAAFAHPSQHVVCMLASRSKRVQPSFRAIPMRRSRCERA